MSDVTCPACGRLHDNPIERLSVGPTWLADLCTFLDERSLRTLCVISDATTHDVLGQALGAELRAAGFAVSAHVFDVPHGLLADEDSAAAATAALARSEARVAIAVGSGTITDITRYAAHEQGIAFCAVPTAASMDGYASNVAAMQFGGVKVSFSTQAPAGIFADPQVIAAAPSDMTRWGIGDLLGKASALFDWRLGHAITGEPYCPLVEARVLETVEACTANAPAMMAGDAAASRLLLDGLVASGVAMAMQGNSRPASGCEHHLSHFFDLLAFRGMRTHQPHGLQVGYATRFTVALQQASLPGLHDALRRVPGELDDAALAYLGASPELSKVAADKRAAFAVYHGAWPRPEDARLAIEASLRDLSGLAARVDAALAALEIPRAPGFADVERDTLEAALRYANRLRNRYTVLDLLESQERLDTEIGALLAQERGSPV